MNDLFETRSAKEKLYDWALTRKYIQTSDVLSWGYENYSNRALRNMQQFAEDGLFVRLSPERKQQLFGYLKEDVWEKS